MGWKEYNGGDDASGWHIVLMVLIVGGGWFAIWFFGGW
jgi:hypothetical protein|tara:strand:- start:1900 stop:2013 length:114 start_codon:yes stop_codon:yes gene_type:complete